MSTSALSLPAAVMQLDDVPFTPYLLGFARACIIKTASAISIAPSQLASPNIVATGSVDVVVVVIGSVTVVVVEVDSVAEVVVVVDDVAEVVVVEVSEVVVADEEVVEEVVVVVVVVVVSDVVVVICSPLPSIQMALNDIPIPGSAPGIMYSSPG